MLKVSKPAANRLDVELIGSLDADSMASALDELIEKSEGISNGVLLYKISGFEVPTLGALAVEFQRMPKLLALVGKFDKCAVLCDTAWIRTAAEIEGAVIPTLTIKSFELFNIEAAEAWLQRGRDSDAQDDEDEDENFPV